MTRQGAAERQRGARRRLELLGLAALAALLLARLDLATLAAGIGLFLWGMSHLEEAVKRLSGGTLDRWLHAATRAPTRAIGVGALATALVQSSSLVTLLAMSFVGAGLVSLTGAIALLFGANLGTTTGAWLIAGFGLRFDLAQYAMPLLAVGLLGRYRLSGPLTGLAESGSAGSDCPLAGLHADERPASGQSTDCRARRAATLGLRPPGVRKPAHRSARHVRNSSPLKNRHFPP